MSTTSIQDGRLALRLLFRSGAHSVTAVSALAIGIGATVTIASAAYTVLARPLPLIGPEGLVVPVSVNAGRGIDRASIPFGDFEDWRQQRDIFANVAAYRPVQLDLVTGTSPERVDALLVTDQFFAVLETRALVGRMLAEADHKPDAPAAAVISDRLWDRSFGRNTAVVGSQIRVGGSAVTVTGVIEARRMWPDESDIWLPLKPDTFDADTRSRRDNMIFRALARLHTGASLEAGRARVAAIAARVATEHPQSRTGWTSDLIPLREFVVEPEIRQGMFVLLGGVALVLLIACVNLANLLLARGADRRREMAVRAALGASRVRIVRQLMVESLLLAVIGGGAGLLLARWLIQALVAAAPAGLPMVDQIAIDWAVVATTAALTIATAVIFGLAPALSTSRQRPGEALRQSSRGTGGGSGGSRTRDVLVVAEIALAIILLVGAGLMVRSFDRLVRVNPGVDVERLLVGRIALPGARYSAQQRVQFYERLTGSLAVSPGVASAAFASYVPAGAGGFGLGRVFLLEGQSEPPASTDHPAQWNVVSPGFFNTVGIRVLRGRGFSERDTATSTPVIVVNETMARRVFGGGDPLGRKMRSWRDENVLREIVGVVSDVRYSGLSDADGALVFVPHRQNAWGSLTVVVRAASGDPAQLAGTLRHEVARLDPQLAVARIAPLTELAADSIGPQRFATLLLVMFATAAALLAGIGIYGVMAYAVTRRRHELGLRLALGATPRGLFRLVVGHGLLLTAVGTVVGLIGAVLSGDALRGLLFGVAPTDPVTLIAVPVVLALVALAACAAPALRAARTEPLTALRAD